MKQWMVAALAAVALAAATVGAQSAPATPQEKPVGTSGAVVAQAPDVPGGTVALGNARITRRVMADGKPLAPGTYQIRVTGDEAKPDVPGQTERLERWAEFLQRGQVKGREVATIVPGSEIGQVADGRPPRPGAAKVELLKGNDYLRIWINKGGTHYLIHLPTTT
jgi:hypothetical protein